GHTGFDVVDRHHLVNPGDEAVLVRVKGKDQLALCRTVSCGLFDSANTAVAILEGVFERASQCPEALIQGKTGLQVAPVGEHFGTRTDARPQGLYQNLVARRRADIYLRDPDPSRALKDDRTGRSFPWSSSGHWALCCSGCLTAV